MQELGSLHMQPGDMIAGKYVLHDRLAEGGMGAVYAAAQVELGYERICHDSGVPAFMLHLRDPLRRELRDELAEPRLERAIGIVYRPETELASHYFQAVLPAQFDEYIRFDETNAVEPLAVGEPASVEPEHPFAP